MNRQRRAQPRGKTIEQAKRIALLERRLDQRTLEARTLLRQLLSTLERERAKIARDLHDQLGQQITALRLALEGLRPFTGPMPELARQASRAEEMALGLDLAIDQLMLELRSEPLDRLGIGAALDQLVTDWAERNRIVADCGTSGVGTQRFDPEIEINLFRIAQEALHNVLKHAQASRVSVSLEGRSDRLQLVIEDNGRGIDAEVARRPPQGRYGLIGMRERAALLGGTLEIESTDGRGTTIYVRVPLADSALRKA